MLKKYLQHPKKKAEPCTPPLYENGNNFYNLDLRAKGFICRRISS